MSICPPNASRPQLQAPPQHSSGHKSNPLAVLVPAVVVGAVVLTALVMFLGFRRWMGSGSGCHSWGGNGGGHGWGHGRHGRAAAVTDPELAASVTDARSWAATVKAEGDGKGEVGAAPGMLPCRPATIPEEDECKL